MKTLLFSLLLCPLLSTAQNAGSRFENDTLYTSCGYKIYKRQTLHLGTGTSAAGYFSYIKFHSNMARNNTYTLQNSTILVTKLRNYKNVGTDDQSIRITGMVTYPDGRKEEADIIMEFEKAIQSFTEQPAELIVPAEFKTKQAKAVPVETKKQPAPNDMKDQLVADEIKKLFDLYKQGALTKEEYEKQKKKLLEQ